MVLVLNKTLMETSSLSPWTIYKTLMANTFNTSAAAYIRVPGTAGYTVYWGDANGKIYDINGTGTTGDGGTENIEILRATRVIDETKDIKRPFSGAVYYRKRGAVDLGVMFEWGESNTLVNSTVVLKSEAGSSLYWGGSNYWNGTNYWNQGNTGQLTRSGFCPPGHGSQFKMTLYMSTKENVEIDSIELRV